MGCCSPSRPKSPSESEIDIPRTSFQFASSKDVQIKNSDIGITVAGSGVAIATQAVEQDAAYWEVHVKQPGKIKLGVSRKLKSGELEGKIAEERVWAAEPDLTVGDVVGISFGQSDLPNLSFKINDEPNADFDVKKIGGLVHPFISVDESAEIEVIFGQKDFVFGIPRTFSPLMASQSLL